MKDVSKDRPLVSITMPCYNARKSLPWAIASCLAQTYENWELVLVDDGSTDNPAEVVHVANDDRIRLITLPENKGRPFARQVALDNARGEYICMLDADDWMYPDRIERQVGVLQRHPNVDLVSGGMAICDASRAIVGVRSTGTGDVIGPFRGDRCPVSHGPSMFRKVAARDIKYNLSLAIGEDFDFLARVLQDRLFVVSQSVRYAYHELESASADKAIIAIQAGRRKRLSNSLSFQSKAMVLARSVARESVYRFARFARLHHLILRRRNRKPTPEEIKQFEAARKDVSTQTLELGIPL